MILIDTSVWVDYFNGRPTPESDRLDGLLGRRLILVGDLILAEVLHGFRSEREFGQALEELSVHRFCELAGHEVVIAGARNYRLLRSRGATIRTTIDIIIGTFCILNGHELLHSDRDFDQMEKHLGLKVLRAN